MQGEMRFSTPISEQSLAHGDQQNCCEIKAIRTSDDAKRPGLDTQWSAVPEVECAGTAVAACSCIEDCGLACARAPKRLRAEILSLTRVCENGMCHAVGVARTRSKAI